MPDIQIDNIQLQIESDSKAAEASVEKLATSLLGLNAALKKIGGNAGVVRRLAKSLYSLEGIKFPDFTRTITQLEQLSNINLSNLENKKLELRLMVSGKDEVERLKYAVENSLNDVKIDTNRLAQDFKTAFNLDTRTTRRIEKEFNEAAKSVSGGGDFQFEFNRVLKILGESGKITKESLIDAVDGLGSNLTDQYRDFLSYVKANPISRKEITGSEGSLQSWKESGLLRSFTTSKEAAKLDEGYFAEVVRKYPDVFSGIASAVGEFDAEVNKSTAGIESQTEAMRKAIIVARDYLYNRVTTVDKDSVAGNYAMQSFGEIQRKVNEYTAQHMENSASKIQLDASIDEKRLESQIRTAIDKIKKIDFGSIPLKFTIDTTEIKEKFKDILNFGTDDVKNSEGGIELIKSLREALSGFENFHIDATGVSALIDSLAKLSAINSGKAALNPQIFIDVAEGLERISFIPDISPTVTSVSELISALTRLAKNADNIKQQAQEVADALTAFFERMANMPEVSENTLRMAEAFAMLAENGIDAGDEIEKLASSNERNNASTKIAETVAGSFGKALKQLIGIYKTLGSVSITAFKAMLSGIKNLASEGVSRLKSFASSLQNIHKSGSGVKGLAVNLRSLLRIALGFRGVYGVFNWLKESVSAGADVAEVNHIVEETFGDLADEIEAWSSDAMEKYGMAQTAAKRYAGTMSAMFQASNIGQSDAAKMATDLVGLAGDLSSFYNIDTETAYNKIKSGMAGMVRPLRDLGLDLSVATLKEYALAQGITKSWTAMSQAEKVMLRYRYLMNSTQQQSGDFEKTARSMANSLRVLRAYIAAVRDALGQGFVAALRHVIFGLNKVMKVILKAANAFRIFMETLFGKNFSGGVVQTDDSSYDDIADDLEDADDSASGMADGIGDASDKAKKLKHDLSVLPFDELNQLNKDTDTASSSKGSGSGGVGVGDIEDFGLEDGLLDKMKSMFENDNLPDVVSEWAERIKAAFKAKDWDLLGKEIAWGLNKGIQKIYDLLDPVKVKEKVTPYIDAFTTTFNSLVDSIHFRQLGQAMARGINDIVYIANHTIEGIDWVNLGHQLAEWANGLVEEIEPEEIGRLFANKLNVFWEVAYGFVHDFDWPGLGVKFGNGAWEFVSHIEYDYIIKTITEGLGGISESLWNFANTFPWLEAGQLWADKANLFIKELPAAKIGMGVGKLIQGIIDALNKLFDPEEGIDFHRLGVKFAIGIYSLIQEVTPESLGQLIANIFNGAIEFLKGAIEVVANHSEDIGSRIGKVFKNAINNVDGKEVGELLKTIWNTGWEILKAAVQTLGDDETGSGTGLGKIIHDAIVEIVDGIEFDDAVETFTSFVGKVAEDIIEIFGDKKTWTDLGNKIGHALVDILTDDDLPGKLAGAVNAVADAIIAMLGSAIDWLITYKDEIGAKFMEFLKKLDWFDILQIVAPLFAANLALSLLGMTLTAAKLVLIGKLAGFISGAFGAKTITGAIGSFASGLSPKLGLAIFKEKFTAAKSVLVQKLKNLVRNAFKSETVKNAIQGFGSVLEKEMSTAIGLVATEGTVFVALTKVVEQVAKLSDKLHGGNGDLSIPGGAVDGLIDGLAENNKIIGETHDKLFLLKEELESTGVKGAEFAEKFGLAMHDAGVSTEDASAMVDYLKGNFHLTGEQIELLDGIIANMGETIGTSGKSFDDFGINSTTAIEKIKGSLTELASQTKGEWSGEGGVLQQMQAAMDEYGGNAQLAVQKVAEAFVAAGGDVNNLREIIDSKLGQEGIFDELTNGAYTASGNIESIGTAAETAQGKVDAAKESQSKLNENANKTPGILTTIKTLATGFAGKLLGLVFPTAKDSDEAAGHLKTALESIPTKLAEVATKMPEAGKAISDGLLESQEKALPKLIEMGEKNATEPAHAFRKKIVMGSPSKLYSEMAESIPQGIAQGINKNVSLVMAAITNLCNKMLNQFKNHFATIKSNLDNTGRDVIQNGLISSMSSAISNGASSIQNSAMSMMNSVVGTLNGMTQSFYNAGQNLASWLRSGFESIYIRTPHIVPWGGYYAQFGDTYTWIPDFAVQWYKRGGLFTNPTIAGFGEAGDEAALPLENSRTMSRIASAIVENSGGIFGADEKKLTSAIAAGFVQAMMANQGNRTPVIINAELKTENNETLARAVIDGMKSIDYRNNPTAQFGF